MNTEKTGAFLRELRKEKNLTQEQLAEKMNVASRTVSRWETGSNMPDLDILIELADFYDLDIQELIDGERKNKQMDQETKATLKKVAGYTEEKTARMKKKMTDNSMAALILLLFCALLEMTSGFGGRISKKAMESIRQFTMGLSIAIMVLNILFLTGKMDTLINGIRKLFKKK